LTSHIALPSPAFGQYFSTAPTDNCQNETHYLARSKHEFKLNCQLQKTVFCGNFEQYRVRIEFSANIPSRNNESLARSTFVMPIQMGTVDCVADRLVARWFSTLFKQLDWVANCRLTHKEFRVITNSVTLTASKNTYTLQRYLFTNRACVLQLNLRAPIKFEWFYYRLMVLALLETLIQTYASRLYLDDVPRQASRKKLAWNV